MRWICIYIFNIFNTLFPINAKVILLHGMKYISAATVFSGLFSKQFIESLFISPLTWSDTSKNICYVLHIDSVMSSWAFQASSLMFQFSLVQSLSCVQFFATPWITEHLLVYHQLLELTQTHVHQVSDAIQPSHLLLSPSPPVLNASQHQGLFQWVKSSHEVAKVLEFQPQHLRLSSCLIPEILPSFIYSTLGLFFLLWLSW